MSQNKDGKESAYELKGEGNEVGSIVRNALKREEVAMAKAANGQGELNPDK